MTTSVVMDMNLHEISNSKKTVNNGGGRRKPKSTELTQKKNKQPQRGMGIEQLERLRKKMTEIPSLHSLPIPSFNPSVTFTTSSSVSVPNGACQFRHVPSHNPAILFPSNRMYSKGPFCLDQYVDPSLIGSSNGGFRSELTSIPNYIKCASDGCGVYHKKKRINGGGSNGCQLNQFRNVVGNNAVVEIDGGKSYRCSPGQVVCNQVREVMRNGVISGMTEYEFIPVKSGGGNTSAAAAWCVGGSSSGGGNEQGCSIDLSLKL